ncbi:MAG: ABC transporter permease [Nanoarchaeota archaeon]|nr:ABC transporter permease [Nanoarchaeota archaeon]
MRKQTAFKIAVNILVHSKIRSWLTIIGIVIGVGSIVAIVSLGTGLETSIEQQLGGLGADLITITPGFSGAQGFGGFRAGQGQETGQTTHLTQTDVQVLKSIPEVTVINAMISGSAELSFVGEKTTVMVTGVDPLAWSQLLTEDIVSGRVLTAGDSNAIVIYENTADLFDNKIVVGKQVTIDEKVFRIVGILEGQGRSVYMPMFAARGLLDKSMSEYDSITVKVIDAELVEELSAEIEQKLLLSHHVTEAKKDFTITSAQALQSQISSITGTFTMFLAGIAAVSLLVGAVGIANTMFTSVLEKTRDIGILKAIGARNADILSIFLINAGLVGLVGGGIGVILGYVVSGMLPLVLPFGNGAAPIVSVEIVLLALGVSFGIGIVTGLIPAYRASKMKPVDALRYE